MVEKAKTIEELREDLESLENRLKTGQKAKKRAKRELEKTRDKLRQAERRGENQGLDGLINSQDPENIPVSSDDSDSLSDLIPPTRNRNSKGTDIEDIKGLSDILDK